MFKLITLKIYIFCKKSRMMKECKVRMKDKRTRLDWFTFNNNSFSVGPQTVWARSLHEQAIGKNNANGRHNELIILKKMDCSESD